MVFFENCGCNTMKIKTISTNITKKEILLTTVVSEKVSLKN
jgi:hypothetical protein